MQVHISKAEAGKLSVRVKHATRTSMPMYIERNVDKERVLAIVQREAEAEEQVKAILRTAREGIGEV